MTSLTNETKRKLISEAHTLKPIVMIGQQGLTANVITEIDRALYDHELIKVRISETEDKAQKMDIANEICNLTKSMNLKLIGHILILYRLSDKSQKRKTNKSK